MLVRLLGILEDGTPRGRDVPASAAHALKVPLGSSLTVELALITSAGAPVALVAGSDVATLTVRKASDCGPAFPAVVGVAYPAAGPNVVRFGITPANTKSLTPGLFVFDAWLARAGGIRECMVPISAFQLLPVATSP